MARPTKLTPEVQSKVCEAIRGGNYRETAAQWVGIDPTLLSKWMHREGEPYESFRQAVLEAEQFAEIRAVALIMKAAAEDPRHAQWWLERKFPERWCRKDRIAAELTGKDGGPLQTETVARVVLFPALETDDDRDPVATEPGSSD